MFKLSLRLLRPAQSLPESMDYAEKRWNEEQRGNGREEQAADHSSTERSILFAAIS